jgi:hypothetical protein
VREKRVRGDREHTNSPVAFILPTLFHNVNKLSCAHPSWPHTPANPAYLQDGQSVMPSSTKWREHPAHTVVQQVSHVFG